MFMIAIFIALLKIEEALVNSNEHMGLIRKYKVEQLKILKNIERMRAAYNKKRHVE